MPNNLVLEKSSLLAALVHVLTVNIYRGCMINSYVRALRVVNKHLNMCEILSMQAEMLL